MKFAFFVLRGANSLLTVESKVKRDMFIDEKSDQNRGVREAGLDGLGSGVDSGNPGGGWRKIVLRGVLRGGGLETDTPGGGWICLTVAGCVTHKLLWKLIHDSRKKSCGN
jgi:hypothetical protein